MPVIDGSIAIDAFDDSTMRNATWRSHIIRPGRPCMSCNLQLDMGLVALDVEGLLDDPNYIQRGKDRAGSNRVGQNVAPLSINVAASLLAQYVSFSVAPGGLGDPGPLQYILGTHELEHLDVRSGRNCLYELTEPSGDGRQNLTGSHLAAETARRDATKFRVWTWLLRIVDDGLTAIAARLDRLRSDAA